MKIAERTEEAGYRRICQSLFGLESFFRRQLWPARLALVAGGVAIVVLLGALFISYGLKLYADWHQTRLLHEAASMLQQGRFSEATQTAQELLAKHPDSLPTLYILAEAAEKQNLEEAISWREQIARLRPEDPDSQLNLVSAALRFGQLDLARKALDRIPSRDRDRAAFHVVAGWLASAEGNWAEQEEQFAAAVKKESKNDLYQFNLAALQIHSSDPDKNVKARRNLERLSQLAPYRTGALRALLNDAVARNDLSAADNLAQQLQMSQEVTFGDYLLCLNFYRKLDEKKFHLLLERVKPFAAKNPSDLASLMEWMNQNGLPGEVVKWIEKLPAEKITAPPASVVVADAYANAKNWTRLKRWTRKGMWGESDYLRLAYQAIAVRQLSRDSGTAGEFDKLWRAAEQSTVNQPERALVLARLASKWTLEKQSEQLWLRVSEDPPLRREALDALRRLYRQENDTGKLYDVLQRLHETSPNEAPITADLARLGLNLERNVERSHDLAKEAHDRAPNELNCAVTYAFSLYRLGRNGDALAIIETLPADQLHDPHAAVYAALVLADTGQLDAARDYANAADNEIYPEEKAVLDKAKMKIASASAVPSPTVSPVSAQSTPTPATAPH
ncbi:MAG TPA: tetratricopeptide repeat protein [Candidatus Udaeobacter sp.]|nr:tetratricopeptide repeat protein [Candidatus Udaeobacter sp.]